MIPKGRELKPSNIYHGHSNKSYKKLTEKEKKAIWFLSSVDKLSRKARVLEKLRRIMNEISINTCYHETNLDRTLVKWKKADIPKREKDLLIRAYELNNKLGESLLNDLESFLNECEKETNR